MKLTENSRNQEIKESILTYTFLHNNPMTDQDLLKQVSKFLSEKTEIETNFESKDAIELFQNLGILENIKGKYSVKSIKDSIEILEKYYFDLCKKDYHKTSEITK